MSSVCHLAKVPHVLRESNQICRRVAPPRRRCGPHLRRPIPEPVASTFDNPGLWLHSFRSCAGIGRYETVTIVHGHPRLSVFRRKRNRPSASILEHKLSCDQKSTRRVRQEGAAARLVLLPLEAAARLMLGLQNGLWRSSAIGEKICCACRLGGVCSGGPSTLPWRSKSGGIF